MTLIHRSWEFGHQMLLYMEKIYVGSAGPLENAPESQRRF